MQYTIVVQSAPENIETAKSTIDFAEALIAAGHTINRIFFYGNGTYFANRLCDYPAPHYNPYEHWKAFLTLHAVEACVCIAAANRRGIVDVQSTTAGGDAGLSNIEAPFELTGLGQLIEACALSDRVVTFK